MSVYVKLNAARKQFHTLQLKKSGLNKFAGYSYFELADFLIPALDVLEQNDLCAFISFGKDLATMTITDVEDGTSIALTSPMAEAQLKGCHPIQNLGAVETYTRRYLWVVALEIVEHDALDSGRPLDNPMDKVASELVQLHDEKLTLEACKLFYQKNLSNEDKEYLWLQLKDHPSLRSAIKSNKPEGK